MNKQERVDRLTGTKHLRKVWRMSFSSYMAIRGRVGRVSSVLLGAVPIIYVGGAGGAEDCTDHIAQSR
jgi:hypothetical protein